MTSGRKEMKGGSTVKLTIEVCLPGLEHWHELEKASKLKSKQENEDETRR